MSDHGQHWEIWNGRQRYKSQIEEFIELGMVEAVAHVVLSTDSEVSLWETIDLNGSHDILSYAAWKGQASVVEWALMMGIMGINSNLFSDDDQEDTQVSRHGLYHWAIIESEKHGQALGVFDVLYRHRFSTNAVDPFGKTPLIYLLETQLQGADSRRVRQVLLLATWLVKHRGGSPRPRPKGDEKRNNALITRWHTTIGNAGTPCIWCQQPVRAPQSFMYCSRKCEHEHVKQATNMSRSLIQRIYDE